MNNTPDKTKTDTTLQTTPNSWFFEPGIPLIFWGFFSVLLLAYYGRAIADPDFWWHLKSGDVMLNQGHLLNIDPFNYTGDVVVHRREAVILKGYWLWQCAAALLYRIWGFYGIFVLKAGTLLLMAGGLMREMRRQAVSPFLQQLLIGLGAVVLLGGYGGFTLERPQIFSFIFVTFLLGMVARIRMGQKPSWLLLPLMAVWSNIHGGIVVGDILLALFAAGAIVQYRNDRARLALLLCWAMAGILASFFNPTGWETAIELFSFSRQNLSNQIDEYRSSWVQFSDVKLIGLLWVIAGLHLAGLFFSRNIFWPEIIISIFLLAFGLRYLRNIPFIALSMLPMTGWYLDRALARLGHSRTRIWQLGVLIILSTLFVWQTTNELRQRNNGWPVARYFPENMARFLRDSGLSGHLFNEYTTGGYLNWVLFPKWQTFIDGRGLNYSVYNVYKEIFLAEGSHEMLLEQYQIDVVALNIFKDGKVNFLLISLLNNSRWIPVYLDSNCFVLARDTEKNSAAIRRFKVNKNIFLNSILLRCYSVLHASPENFDLTVGYTELLICAGKYPEAEIMINKMERMRPGAEIISMLRRSIDTSNIRK